MLRVGIATVLHQCQIGIFNILPASSLYCICTHPFDMLIFEFPRPLLSNSLIATASQPLLSHVEDSECSFVDCRSELRGLERSQKGDGREEGCF